MSDQLEKTILCLELELQNHHGKVAQDIVRYYEQTETISKYFLAFGRRFPNSTLFRLHDSSHNLLTENKAILKEAAKFYSDSSKMTNESCNETILDMFLPNDYKVINEAQRFSASRYYFARSVRSFN